MAHQTRSAALAQIRAAGYHDDQKTFVRTYVENRVSIGAATAEYRSGAQARLAGVRCTCRDCSPAAGAAS